MSLTLNTITVLLANGLMAITAATLLMLVLWQSPRQRANQLFALVMTALILYSIVNIFIRFIADLALDINTVVYSTINLYGLFTIAIFFFATHYAQTPTVSTQVLRVAGLILFGTQSYMLWTGNILVNIQLVEGQPGNYQGEWTAWGHLTAGTIMLYQTVTALQLRFSPNPRARDFWPAPALMVCAALSVLVIWPVVPIPLNAIFLAMSALALGRPVLRRELFYPLAELNAELAERNRALENASNMKSQFLTNMSYELRTPLSSIIGYTELVLDNTYGPLNDTQRDRLEKVARNGHHLLNLINDVLDLNRIEAGVLLLNKQVVTTASVLNSVLATVEPLAQHKGLVIKREYDDLPSVWADELRLRQIVTNILSNAIKFTLTGSVTLRARTNGQQLQLEISDTGIGIPPSEHDKVFVEFEQVDNSSTRRYDGTGLGLAITKHLVEMHDGCIWMQSAPDVGTTFFVTLPLAPASVAHTAA